MRKSTICNRTRRSVFFELEKSHSGPFNSQCTGDEFHLSPAYFDDSFRADARRRRRRRPRATRQRCRCRTWSCCRRQSRRWWPQRWWRCPGQARRQQLSRGEAGKTQEEKTIFFWPPAGTQRKRTRKADPHSNHTNTRLTGKCNQGNHRSQERRVVKFRFPRRLLFTDVHGVENRETSMETTTNAMSLNRKWLVVEC